jgi:hypothetical protein
VRNTRADGRVVLSIETPNINPPAGFVTRFRVDRVADVEPWSS